MAASEISVVQAWPASMFLCQWAEHQTRGPRIVAHIKERAATFRKPVESGVATSAKPAAGLIESPLDLFNASDNPDLQALVAWIRQSVLAVVHKMNGASVPMNRLNLRFNQSWFHITNDGGFHDAHIHGNCSWCGIYYLVAGDVDDVPADGADKAGNGVNRFYSPVLGGGLLRDYGNSYLGRNYIDVQPVDGRLVIFPAFLLHSALPYRGEKDRVIVSFNSQTNVIQA